MVVLDRYSCSGVYKHALYQSLKRAQIDSQISVYMAISAGHRFNLYRTGHMVVAEVIAVRSALYISSRLPVNCDRATNLSRLVLVTVPAFRTRAWYYIRRYCS